MAKKPQTPSPAPAPLSSDVTTSAKPPKVRISVRDWLDSAGNPLDSGEEPKVEGFRYVSLPAARAIKPDFDPETDTPPDGSAFSYMFTDLIAVKMLAAFGAETLAGNVVNTERGKDKSSNPVPQIAARFAGLADHLWVLAREGGAVQRFDKDKLILAILAVKGTKDEAPYRAKLETKVDPKTGAQVPNDQKGAISFGAFALRVDAIKAEYNKLTGNTVSIDLI